MTKRTINTYIDRLAREMVEQDGFEYDQALFIVRVDQGTEFVAPTMGRCTLCGDPFLLQPRQQGSVKTAQHISSGRTCPVVSSSRFWRKMKCADIDDLDFLKAVWMTRSQPPASGWANWPDVMECLNQKSEYSTLNWKLVIAK